MMTLTALTAVGQLQSEAIDVGVSHAKHAASQEASCTQVDLAWGGAMCKGGGPQAYLPMPCITQALLRRVLHGPN